jgi:hypothetical protein
MNFFFHVTARAACASDAPVANMAYLGLGLGLGVAVGAALMALIKRTGRAPEIHMAPTVQNQVGHGARLSTVARTACHIIFINMFYKFPFNVLICINV